MAAGASDIGFKLPERGADRPPLRLPADPGPLRRVESITVPDPILAWRLVPHALLETNGWVVATNSLGFRDREVRAPKPAGEIRLLCLGDSMTFGWGLDVPEMWTTLLEVRLARSSSCLRVVNAAVYGYGTTQALALLREGRVLGLEPDIVLLQFGLNDATGPSARPARLLGRSALVRCLMRLPRPTAPAHIRSQERGEAFRRNLTELIRWLAGHGMSPIVMGQAVARGADAEWHAELPRFVRIARQTASDEGVAFVDLARSFARLTPVKGMAGGGSEEGARYFLDGVHPTARGAHVVAEAIHETMARELLVSPRPMPRRAGEGDVPR